MRGRERQRGGSERKRERERGRKRGRGGSERKRERKRGRTRGRGGRYCMDSRAQAFYSL